MIAGSADSPVNPVAAIAPPTGLATWGCGIHTVRHDSQSFTWVSAASIESGRSNTGGWVVTRENPGRLGHGMPTSAAGLSRPASQFRAASRSAKDAMLA